MLFRAKDYGSAEGALQAALQLVDAEHKAGNRALLVPKLNKWGDPWGYRVDVVQRVMVSSIIGRRV